MKLSHIQVTRQTIPFLVHIHDLNSEIKGILGGTANFGATWSAFVNVLK